MAATVPTQEHADTWLSLFEMPRWLVEPAVRSCRQFNTSLDRLFYDVSTLQQGLAERDEALSRQGETKLPSRIVSFDALTDPEGSLLWIDASAEPCVHRYQNIETFLDSPYDEVRRVHIATITGVGSSALGSAALAWDVSVALEQPVLAIVPGYGVADLMQQALGGWFAYGMHDILASKHNMQKMLAAVAPQAAGIGRQLAGSSRDAEDLRGAPVFRFGSGSADVLHDLLERRPGQFKVLVGHSKGALQIGNAVRSLDASCTEGLQVVTLGCPIRKEVDNIHYHQYLGLYDALGQLNAWGNPADHQPETWHTTNPKLPAAMAAGDMTRESVPKRL